jgi:hypothetical protein
MLDHILRFIDSLPTAGPSPCGSIRNPNQHKNRMDRFLRVPINTAVVAIRMD